MDFRSSIELTQQGPKYSRIIQLILTGINQNTFRPGDRVPSIKEASEQHLISRDTVEKAYKELSQQGVLISVPGKGYYVKGKSSASKLKVMSVFPDLAFSQQQFYQSLLQTLGKQAVSHLFTYHRNEDILLDTLTYHLGDFDFYVIWPGPGEQSPRVRQMLKKIPQNKLILVDPFSCSTSMSDMSARLQALWLEHGQGLEAFPEWHIMLPRDPATADHELGKAISNLANSLKTTVSESLGFNKSHISKDQLIMVWDDDDLAQLLNWCDSQGLSIGTDLGIISMNEHPLKSALAGGLTTLSLQADSMGQQIASIILQQSKEKVTPCMKLTRRTSA